METILAVILLAIVLILQIFLLWRTYDQGKFQGLDQRFDESNRNIHEQMQKNREEFSLNSRLGREELTAVLRGVNDSVLTNIVDMGKLNARQQDVLLGQMSRFIAGSDEKMDKIRETVERQLKSLQDDNANKLEQMRNVVDEKLHVTLERRLGESFKLVSEQLEQVQKSMGEMQTLAVGVGDLKRVLSNVKTRGILGETQLGFLIEEILTPEQYEKNVATKKGSAERVEFAIKIPSKDADEHAIWLPIDAKFPLEDYQRLLDAQENNNIKEIEQCGKALAARIRQESKSIRDKYISPPETTDFALLFLPAEGLYAEVLRQAGLFEELQREYKVILTGPTTLAALVHSLQIGFRTLAIEKHSSEIWRLLGSVKTEFSRFSQLLEKTQQKLTEASHTIEDAARKSRTIERKLKNVQESDPD
ncbi:MAG: DNA recombination protein RmuC [Peptococcaceae bacterium]|jgi:DNA recombination protein RmuC|nr:DNA recombination protein RmuC [Peptococcaceae bacterium]